MVDCWFSIIVRVFASRDFPCYCRAYRAVSRELDKKTGHWFFAEKDLVYLNVSIDLFIDIPID